MHIGIVRVGVVTGRELGYYCALVMVVAHGVCSPLLFGVAFFMYTNRHTRIIALNRGSLSSPMVGFIIFMLLAVNMGLPPFLNVWAEVLMFSAICSLFVSSLPFVILSAFVGVLYNLLMYTMLSHGKERSSVGNIVSP